MVEALSSDGNPEALHRLAIWRLAGQPLPRDLPLARRYLRSAAASGHRDAARLEVALLANGSGGNIDFSAARALLEELAKVDAEALRQVSLIRRMTIDEQGMPISPIIGAAVNTSPRILRFASFLTSDECREIASAAVNMLTPSVVVDPKTGLSTPNPIRSSDGALLGPTHEALTIRAINLRIAAASGTDVAQGEALAVLRYRGGQQYRLHHDAIGGARNQRCKTMLIYLNDGFLGGETNFPAIGKSIAPQAGDAILFDNVTGDGRIDQRSQHTGEPVRQGEKWLATRWIRSKPFDVWTGTS